MVSVLVYLLSKNKSTSGQYLETSRTYEGLGHNLGKGRAESAFFLFSAPRCLHHLRYITLSGIKTILT